MGLGGRRVGGEDQVSITFERTPDEVSPDQGDFVNPDSSPIEMPPWLPATLTFSCG